MPTVALPWAPLFSETLLSRPHGFLRFVKKNRFHSVYLIATEAESPIKVGIAADPIARLAEMQTAHFAKLRLLRSWWMPGRPVTLRIENAFKSHFRPYNVRGEWFDLPLATAEEFIDTSIRRIGTWGVRQSDIIDLMDNRERHRYRVPQDAPSPLRGLAS